MNIVIGIVIGIIIGAGIVYWWSQQQLDKQLQEAENKQQQLQASLESDHEKRLQDTITSLQTDYDRQGNQKIAAAKQESETAWQSRLATLETEYEKRQQEKEQEYQQRIIAIQTQHQQELQNETAWQNRLASLESEYEQKQQEYEQRITAIQTQQQQELQQQQQSHEAQIQRIEQEYAAKLKVNPETPPLPLDEKAVTVEKPRDRDFSFADTIESWGNTGSMAYIPQLASHLYSPDSRVREAIAVALGKIAKDRAPRFEIIQIIEYLARLCRDANANVRKAAIASLGKIKAENVLPLLKQGLRDSNSDVVQAASNAIARYKSYSQTPRIKTLPRNARPSESL
ncbi:MAG: HEAT repeat domain-containing protein [Jaaginema sp. PMC 1079.18]|nr:HEAT repeat domain-containing protein [Jaaginema sp. PMC 1080.18]MEC4852678.1 HEAT repeat domain-containing protein [Jaaginema sp. PMC 1079.18]MEC4868399.1 HEAT repeat domain-containing protein [Jaaginema sp. PMC 1078.18]